MPEFRLITEDAPFRALGNQWNRLLGESDHDSPFLSWEWISSWWDYYGTGQVYIPTIWSEEKLIAAVPLFFPRDPGPLRTLRMMGTGLSDYLDFLVLRDRASELYPDLLSHLLVRKEFDLLFLEQVPPSRLEWIGKVSRKNGYPIRVKPRGHCYAAALPNNFDEYMAGLGKNERYNIRRRRRALEKEHGVTFSVINRPGLELKKKLDEFYDLMERRLAMRGRRPAVDRETGLRFHKSLAEKFSEKGWFGLYMLEKQGEMIAGLIAFEWSRKLFYYYSGFDPKWARYSVGMVLLSRCIEDGITRGIKEFDFMRGRASYKLKWNIEERPYHHITMARGRTILLKYLIENFSERVKKKWRKRKAS